MSLISLYLDDSDGNRGTQKFCVWGGLITTEAHSIVLSDRLTALKAKWGLSKHDPVKWSPKEGKDDYKGQRSLSDQNGFKSAVLDLIGTSDITLIAAVFLDDQGLSKSDMQIQLINDLSVRFQFDLQDKRRKESIGYRGALVLAYPGTSNQLISKTLYELHKGGANFKSRNYLASASATKVKLDCLESAVYFSYEAHNPLLQLSDFVSSSVAWTLKRQDFQFFEKIRPRFRNVNENIKGAGLLVYPNHSTFVDELCRQPKA
jgi:hypothetical protein